jgi:hypothetical protein
MRVMDVNNYESVEWESRLYSYCLGLLASPLYDECEASY